MTIIEKIFSVTTTYRTNIENLVFRRYLSWIAQLVRALARKAKGPGSSPGPGYNFSLLNSILNLLTL